MTIKDTIFTETGSVLLTKQIGAPPVLHPVEVGALQLYYVILSPNSWFTPHWWFPENCHPENWGRAQEVSAVTPSSSDDFWRTNVSGQKIVWRH